MTWIRRLREAWTRNDGKPRENWAPGRDIKETVMLIALAVLLVLQSLALGWMAVEAWR